MAAGQPEAPGRSGKPGDQSANGPWHSRHESANLATSSSKGAPSATTGVMVMTSTSDQLFPRIDPTGADRHLRASDVHLANRRRRQWRMRRPHLRKLLPWFAVILLIVALAAIVTPQGSSPPPAAQRPASAQTVSRSSPLHETRGPLSSSHRAQTSPLYRPFPSLLPISGTPKR